VGADVRDYYRAHRISRDDIDSSMTTSDMRIAVFGGGCFWCTEAVFQDLKGVISVMPGYAGGIPSSGSGQAPTYEEVRRGKTGHAEVIQIEFDPAQIAYRDLAEIFFATHNPTTKNRQGADVGEQYRSIILYADEEQKKAAEEVMKEIQESGAFDQPIVTELKPLKEFYPAEDYHHNYYQSNPGAGYCQAVIAPKLEKFKKKYASLLKEKS